VEHHELDITFEKSGALSGKATTTFVSLRNGLHVVPLSLFPTLRVQSVTANGSVLSFIQEDKNDDADFAVILPKPLNEGEKFTITTTYAGKDAVTNEGSGNYMPIARQNWYPNGVGSALGEYATYDMTFRIPKGMKLAATGALVSDTNEGNQNVTVWKSENPQTVAGFSFGKFKVEETKLTKPPVFIQSFANEESPSWVRSFQRSTETNDLAQGPYGATGIASGMPVGTMSTVTLNKKALAEGEIAVQIYTDYFGPSQFTRLELTQQTACNFGQSWPGLVWIPICYYFDTTVRHALGLDWGDRGYWTVVTPHEVAHQWWGHTVGCTSYRDQWMSEGFADMSASLYLSLTEKDQKKFMKFWSDERDILLEKDAQGFRPIDVGPLTMGYRANNSRTGFGVTSRLIYPKGAYVLHMIRMMMWDPHAGDKPFKDAMQDFVNTYRGKAASTEDFKASLEKHMSPQMDMDGNHKLDWFFNEYVYGTQIPSYKFDSTLSTDPDGSVVLSFNISQFNVDGKFAMLVPIYLELEDGRVIMLARAPVIGSTTFSDKISLKALKAKPRRAMINYHYDVLASN
jgi:aminopeptidase N